MSHAHPITRLVTRYGQAHGMYLYGEYCLLITLGFDAFRRRHTETQLQALAAQLAPLALWPEGVPGHPAGRMEGVGILEGVATTLTRPPLMLGLGIDLYFACLAWAGSQDGVQGDPAAWFEPSRGVLARQLGFMPPNLVVQLDDGVTAHGYRLYVWGEAVAEGEAFPGLDLMLGPPEDAPPPLQYAWSRDPAGSGWVTWLPIGPGATPPASLERLHWIVAMNRHVTAVLPRHAAKLLTAPVVHNLLQEAEATGYDHELERYVSIPELRLVFQALLRQGLKIEAAPALEGMLTSVLSDLASREVSPAELEKIARQLPVFPTQKLVGVVRKAMGLPEQPPPTLTWGGGPPPQPLPVPPVAPDQRARWQELLDLAREQRPEVERAVRVLRAIAPPRWRRSGYGLRWSFHVPLGPPEPMAPERARELREGGRLGQIQRVVERHLELVGYLAEIETELAAPGAKPLSAPARAMLAEPSWPEHAWLLKEPGRLLAALGI